MRLSLPCLLAIFLLQVPLTAVDAQTPAKAVAAVVETTLPTSGGHIRQFAFDGKPDTYFASAKNAGKDDHFTLVFDKPITIRTIDVVTGTPKGEDALKAGVLEISADGKTFQKLTAFNAGVARAKPDGSPSVKAVRVRPTDNLRHPLAIREITIVSEPKVTAFKYPIEFIVDVTDAPEMKEWADKVARICERNYTMINDELISEGFKPRTQISMTLKSNYKGVAAAGGGRITGSVKFFKAHPDDVGAMIHETVHCVQAYRTRGPGWLVEGIADYVRFFKYEPGKIGKIKTDSHYNGSYRTTAAFLNFAAEKYDKNLVKKVNKAMREGEYREEIWKALTKKTLKELDDEWRASMKKGAVSADLSLVVANHEPAQPGLVTTIIQLKIVRASTAMQLVLKSGIKAATQIDPKGNALIVRGTAEQVKEAKALIGSLESPAQVNPPTDGKPDFQYHDIETGNINIALRFLEHVLRDKLRGSDVRMTVAGPKRIFVYANQKLHKEIEKLIDAQWGSGDPLADVKAALEIQKGNDGKNEPSPKKLELPKRLEKDDGRKNEPSPKKLERPKAKSPAPIGESTLQIYPVPGGNSDAIAKLLQEVFRPKNARIVPLGTNQVAVWADPQTHLELAKQRPLAPGVTLLIPLNSLDPAKTAKTLKAMFGEPKTGGPYIEADAESNGVRVRGSAEQVDDIKHILRILDGGTGTPGNVRVIHLDRGSGATLAEVLSVLLGKMRPNTPVRVVLPASVNSTPAKAKDEKKATPGAKGVTLTAIGNRLIIATDDPELMELVSQMVRILRNAAAADCDFEVIRLKHAKAVDAARVLDEAFNKEAKRQDRMRVIAVANSNSLLVRATPIDMITIRMLLERAIDVPAENSRGGPLLKKQRK